MQIMMPYKESRLTPAVANGNGRSYEPERKPTDTREKHLATNTFYLQLSYDNLGPWMVGTAASAVLLLGLSLDSTKRMSSLQERSKAGCRPG
jgi:hypothetical protein